MLKIQSLSTDYNRMVFENEVVMHRFLSETLHLGGQYVPKFFDYWECTLPNIKIPLEIADYGIIVMEKCDGTLFELLQKDPQFKDSKNMINYITKIISKITYINVSFAILHRDLKLENILYRRTEDGVRLLISDWGLATKFNYKNNFPTANFITPYYQARGESVYPPLNYKEDPIYDLKSLQFSLQVQFGSKCQFIINQYYNFPQQNHPKYSLETIEMLMAWMNRINRDPQSIIIQCPDK